MPALIQSEFHFTTEDIGAVVDLDPLSASDNAIDEGLVVNSATGGIEIDTGGSIRGGLTDFDDPNNNGFFSGFDQDTLAHVATIGDPSNEHLTWNGEDLTLDIDGSNLTVNGGTTGQGLVVASDGTVTFVDLVNVLNDLSDVNATPTVGQFLKWSGTEWAPAADNSSTGGAGGVVGRLLQASVHLVVQRREVLQRRLWLSQVVQGDLERRQNLAVEFVHSYSLIHDDLPGMDNDDLRRGKPTTHKKFGEAIAILAGNSLLTLAFELLADSKTHIDSKTRLGLITNLAKMSGSSGLAGGQSLDLLYEKKIVSEKEIIMMHDLKTAKLFEFCMLSPLVLSGKNTPAREKEYRKYGKNFGLIFHYL